MAASQSLNLSVRIKMDIAGHCIIMQPVWTRIWAGAVTLRHGDAAVQSK
jgi:hypothetical protein